MQFVLLLLQIYNKAFWLTLRACYKLYGNNSALKIAGENLRGKSFRISHHDEQDVLFLFKVIKRTWKQLRIQQADIQSQHSNEKSNPDAAILDGTHTAFQQRMKYVTYFSDSVPRYFISRDTLLQIASRKQFIIGLFCWIPFLICLLPAYVFTKHKSALALCVMEFWEHTHLLTILKSKKVTHLLMFCIYEKDTNLLYLLLHDFDITVSKVTSEVPIAIWNRRILTDKLILCHPYQEEEVKHFQSTIRYDNLLHWGPERIYESAPAYESPTLKPGAENCIGFYSTASWLRAKAGHIQQAVSNPKHEEKILHWLHDFLEAHSGSKLIVFLHPKERKAELLEETKDHYRAILGGSNWEFAPFDKPSSSLFDCVSVGIAQFTTILFERSYLGFEVVFVPFEVSDFPVKDSEMEKNCVYTKSDLHLSIEGNS